VTVGVRPVPGAFGDPDTPIVLGKGVIQRHVFIGGGIGSGKSYTRGVLAEELHAFGIPQVNMEGTARSLKDSSQITTIPKFTDMVDLSIAKKVVQQLGPVKNFPY